MPILRPRVTGGDERERDGRVAASPTSEKDGVISAITKWIPIEIIAFYQGLTTPFGNDLAHWLWWAIVAGTVVTFLWIAFATESAQKASRIAWRQVVLACVAFVFWVVGTTSPDVWKALLSWWVPGISPAALALGAVALPITDGVMRRLGVPQD
jgi:hypothetical protein